MGAEILEKGVTDLVERQTKDLLFDVGVDLRRASANNPRQVEVGSGEQKRGVAQTGPQNVVANLIRCQRRDVIGAVPCCELVRDIIPVKHLARSLGKFDIKVSAEDGDWG